MGGLLFFVMACGAASAAPSGIKVAVHPQTVPQGQAALITVSSPTPLTELQGRFHEQNIAFWECGKKLCGIVAVQVNETPGPKDLILEWKTEKQNELKTSFRVKKGTFKVNKLKVEPKITKPSAEDQTRIAQDKKDIEAAYLEPERKALWSGAFVLPTTGEKTSGFGNQRTYNGEVKSIHFGVDLRANTQTPIYATNAGKVVLAKEFFMAGNMVLLDHGMGVYSSYAHLSVLSVQAGQLVAKGDKIGMAGATGRATGPHLHWGMRVNSVAVDPHSLVRALNRMQ